MTKMITQEQRKSLNEGIQNLILEWMTNEYFFWIGKPGKHARFGFVGKLSEAAKRCEEMTDESGSLVMILEIRNLVKCPTCKRQVPDFEVEQFGECCNCDTARTEVNNPENFL